MRLFFTKKALLIFLISLLLTGGIFLLSILLTVTSTVNDTHGLIRLVGLPNTELLAGQKIKGNFRALFSNLGIVSVRFTNFGRISTDQVAFRLKEENSKTWIYENIYRVDQFQPNQFFTFGFPVQSGSANKSYFFEIESVSGQKGNAIGLSKYKPTVQFTYAFSKSDFLYKPKHTLEIMQYFAMQKLSQKTIQLLFSGLFVGIFLCLFAITNFINIINAIKKNKKKFYVIMRYMKHHSLLFIIVIGLFLRLLLAAGPYNGDANNAVYLSKYIEQHIYNVYAHSNEHGYNYSPLIFYVFATLAVVKNVTNIPFPFLWRASLSIFDLGTLIILIQLAKMRKINPTQTAFLFFLNPVSIFISGFHGQFENMAIFFLLLAVLLHYKTINKKNPKRFLKWLYLTVGILVKHIIVYQLPVFWRAELKKKYQIILFSSLSIFIFLASFLPFWFGAQRLIIQNVFLYGGIPGYGIANFFIQVLALIPFVGLISEQLYKLIFILSLFIIPLFLSRKDMLRNMLFMFLFFLTFTPGIGIQYFTLPIAIATLFPTRWFYIYSVAIGLVIEIIEQPIPLPFVRSLPIDGHVVPWLVVAIWFVSEFLYLSKRARKIYSFIPQSSSVNRH